MFHSVFDANEMNFWKILNAHHASDIRKAWGKGHETWVYDTFVAYLICRPYYIHIEPFIFRIGA